MQGDTAIVGMEQARSLYETHIKAITEAKNAAYKAENEAWLKDNATKSGVVTLPSGLQYKVLTAGTGAKPTAEQTVEVVYEGKMIDGTVFDATSRHNGQKTDKFECNRVIKGWTEALTNMPVGWATATALPAKSSLIPRSSSPSSSWASRLPRPQPTRRKPFRPRPPQPRRPRARAAASNCQRLSMPLQGANHEQNARI